MNLENLVLYVNNCSGCDHWREYEYVNRGFTDSGKVILNFRCSSCGNVKAIVFQWNSLKS